MRYDQISAIYDYLCSATNCPQNLRNELEALRHPWDSPTNTMLYLPMYSWGLGVGTVKPRIEFLRDRGWNVDKLANAKTNDRDKIAEAQISTGIRFGMKNRIDQLISRAVQIKLIGVDLLSENLKPRAGWNCHTLLQPLQLLRRFHGVGSTAALHILMNLNWGVVKPDRHICRFLSRLGGQWSVYFSNSGAETVGDEIRLLLVEAWGGACDVIGKEAQRKSMSWQYGDVQFPSLADLTPRQIDFLVMLYTQDVPKLDLIWRPEPICTVNPKCGKCRVPECEARQDRHLD